MTGGNESSNARGSSENPGGPVQESNTTISGDTTDNAPAKAPYHPSDDINSKLLEEFPEAAVALTHDDDWMPVIQRGPIPSADELYSRVKTVHDPVCDSGVAQLKPKESSEQSRERDN